MPVGTHLGGSFVPRFLVGGFDGNDWIVQCFVRVAGRTVFGASHVHDRRTTPHGFGMDVGRAVHQVAQLVYRDCRARHVEFASLFWELVWPVTKKTASIAYVIRICVLFIINVFM